MDEQIVMPETRGLDDASARLVVTDAHTLKAEESRKLGELMVKNMWVDRKTKGGSLRRVIRASERLRLSFMAGPEDAVFRGGLEVMSADVRRFLT